MNGEKNGENPMADFIRARSPEQKCQRMDCIKAVAERQFETRPYHEVTLTTIAEELGWSRASLYKYVTTKEEIFLALSADERDAYMDDLLAALPEGCGFSRATIAEVWAAVANAHRSFFGLGTLLYTVIETNVSVERLVEFKRGYYEQLELLEERLSGVLGVDAAEVEPILSDVYYHGVGVAGSCHNNPLVREALVQLGREAKSIDFREEMRSFIALLLGA